MGEQDTLDPSSDTLSPEATEVLETAEADPKVEINAGKEEQEVEETVPIGTWYDNLGPDYKNDPEVTKYKSLEEYVKGNREVRKMIGKDKLVVPTDKSTPEEVNEFYKKLGRPGEVSEYTTPDFDMPEELKISDAQLEAYKKTAFDAGVTQKQYETLLGMQRQMTLDAYNKELENVKAMAGKTETSLRTEYGAAYESKIDGAQRVINTFFKGQQMHKAFSALQNDEGFVKAMVAISENLGEDVIAGQTRQTLTPKEAESEVNSIMSGSHDLSKAYFDELNPEHDTAVERVLDLQKLSLAGA